MENININLPAACYNVEKILGVQCVQGNQKNYKVQWAPSWVSEIHLVGCTGLIQQFLDKGGDAISNVQDKVVDEVKEEEESSVHQKEVENASHSVDIFSSELPENDMDSHEDDSPSEELQPQDSNEEDEATDDISTTPTENVIKDITPECIKIEEQEEVTDRSDEVAVTSDDVKEEEPEASTSSSIETTSFPNNVNFVIPPVVEDNIVTITETCPQSPNATISTSKSAINTGQRFNLHGDNYHFGQYLKEKDAPTSLPTISTDRKKVVKPPFTYEDISAYPSYPETHTIVDKTNVGKQTLSRKRAISLDTPDVSTYTKYPNTGLQKLDKSSFSKQQSSNPRCSKLTKQVPGVDIQTTIQENTQTSAIASSIDIQGNLDIQSDAAFSLSTDIHSNAVTIVNPFAQHPSKTLSTTIAQQSIVDLTDEGGGSMFTKHKSGVDKYGQNKNNYIDPGGLSSMTSYVSSTSNSFVNSQAGHEAGGLQEVNSFQQTCNTDEDDGTIDSPNTLHTKVFGSPPIQGSSNSLTHDHPNPNSLGLTYSKSIGKSNSSSSCQENEDNSRSQADLRFNSATLSCEDWNEDLLQNTEERCEISMAIGAAFHDQVIGYEESIGQSLVTSVSESNVPLTSAAASLQITFNETAEFNHVGSAELKMKYLCDQSSTMFSSEELYNEHMKKTHKNIFRCKFCFQDKKGKRCQCFENERRNNLNRPYKCDVCFVRFKDISNLVVHVRRKHTMERPYKCNICPKMCCTSSDLKKHIRVHTGERPFACTRCDKAFNTSSHLSTHTRRVHTMERPHKCTLCVKQFTTTSDLKKHLLSAHTKEKLFECSVCFKKFRTRFGMKEHHKRCVLSTAAL